MTKESIPVMCGCWLAALRHQDHGDRFGGDEFNLGLDLEVPWHSELILNSFCATTVAIAGGPMPRNAKIMGLIVLATFFDLWYF